MRNRTGSTAIVMAFLLGFGSAGAWELDQPFPVRQPEPIGVAVEPGETGPKGFLLDAPFDHQAVELVNQQRWEYNNGQLPPLKKQDQLVSSAYGHSERMAVGDFFAHCDLDTLLEFWERILAAGYSFSGAAENIAGGQATPASVIQTWMSSPGHRANILSTTYREIGVGYYHQPSDVGNIRRDLEPAFPSSPDCVADDFNNGPYQHYWTQNFGVRSSVYPVVINREAYETTSRTVDLYLYGTGWATEMRIRNDCDAWGAWQSFAADVPGWELCVGDGEREVFVEIRNGGTTRSASDIIVLNAGSDVIFEDGFETGSWGAWDYP